jgi:hypothetical protein
VGCAEALEDMGDWPMSEEEAMEHRAKLMAQRTAF